MRTPLYKSRPVEPSPARFGGERVNEFIVLSEAFSNCYLLETAAGDIQVNAGMGMEAPVIAGNFDQLSRAGESRQLKYLILTQGHVDHVGGAGWLRDRYPGLSVLAQAGNPEHQQYDARLATFRGKRSGFAFTQKFADAFNYYAEQGYTDFPAQDTPVPDVLVEDRYAFSLGGLDVQLIAVPGAETNDSLIVWLPQHRICLTGNLFGCPFGHFPNLVTIRGDRYRDALTVAAAAQTVLDLEPEMILYGHHGPVIGRDVIATELQVLRDAIHFVHDATVAGMNAGKDVYTLMSEIELPAELEVGQGYGKVSWGVRAIWENYAGWFHHESTTELYCVPRCAVSTDLVELAGGSTAIVKRAQQKIAAGLYPEAIHLLDIVLEDDSTDAAARAIAVTAHQQLLSGTDNFWLSAWLRQRIAELQ